MLTLIKQSGVVILVTDKVDFRARKIFRDREGHNKW